MTNLKFFKNNDDPIDESKKLKHLSGTNAFVADVARYFMDFLETDFHKRRLPKRSVQFRNSKNLEIGIKLKKYPKFNALVWKAINNTFDNDIIKTIKKKTFVTKIPDSLLDLITKQIENIKQEEVDKVVGAISEDIKFSVKKFSKEADIALDSTLDNTGKLFKEFFITPLVQKIEKPLETLASANVDSIFLIEEDLTGILVDLIDNKISEIVNLLLADKEVKDIPKELATVLTLQATKDHISRFFKHFAVKDLFAELYSLFNNKNLLDKQQFYLYFCDITVENATFPIFYIPLELERVPSGFGVTFDSVLYVNKKALDYVAQEYNKANEKIGSLKTIQDRVIYLSEEVEGHLLGTMDGVMKEIADFFELKEYIDLNRPEDQTVKGMFVSISNSCYLSLFDQSDEALVNDYETILELLESGNSKLADTFNKLIDSFIHDEPESFVREVEEEWDGTETQERLVCSTPIPLNAEQRQIILALKKPTCKYVTVEGPPGTGKSHTITAVLFNAILDGQSVLVLSDKKEALDVVENKITETMNKVRVNANFQNPILRLGKAGNTYNQILSTTSIKEIKTYHRAYKKEAKVSKKQREDTSNNLKILLKKTIENYEEIKLEDIEKFHMLEAEVVYSGTYSIDFDEIFEKEDPSLDLVEAREKMQEFHEDLDGGSSIICKVFSNLHKDNQSLDSFNNFVTLLEIINDLKSQYPNISKFLTNFSSFSEDDFQNLKPLIESYSEIKHDWFGFLFVGRKVKELNSKFREKFSAKNVDHAHKSFNKLKLVVDFYDDAIRHKEKRELSDGFDAGESYFKTLHNLTANDLINASKDDLKKLLELIERTQNFVDQYPKTSKLSKVDLSLINGVFKNKLFEHSDKEFANIIHYIKLKQRLESQFAAIPNFSYSAIKSALEELTTAQMTHIMDGRVIDFYEEKRNTVKSLKEVIKGKKKFPKDDFLKLKSAFPCILAGIRDFAEYIPMEQDLFDLVIIDEASQVSIAQAFPALLRTKKVLVLGDRKQFSNVKSAHARTDTNKEYLNKLENTFRKHVSEDVTKLTRLNKFNIKTSILEFCEHITNYNIMLLKHFRGYKELISYSNHYFYDDSLQAIKIRGKNIDEVIKFSMLEHDKKIELLNNTNQQETETIIAELKRILKEQPDSSVGIITPHTNQQKMLVDAVAELSAREDLYERLKLKIMTFDTCQGEERDIIIYSMVASPVEDQLRWIFIKDLNSVDLEADGMIRAQRLNVGLSRSKECLHFVCSKPLEHYGGSIGEALRYYKKVLDEAHKLPDPDSVDPKSPMEKKVLDWIQQTAFFKAHKEDIRLDTQFPLGEYLKQLDKFYNHPNYVVDFLLVYREDGGKEYKIIIEYDGFEGHFKRDADVDRSNYANYYTDEHVEREKILESYGYKFLRINRFNVGKAPITTLNDRLEMLLKKNSNNLNSFLENIQSNIKGLNEGDMKECPNCCEVKTIHAFKDLTLKSGIGTVCVQCKILGRSKKRPHRLNTVERLCQKCGETLPIKEFKDNTLKSGYSVHCKKCRSKQVKTNLGTAQSGIRCPSCGSAMVLRARRRDGNKFYGCSRFPRCKGTKHYSGD